MSSIPAFYLCPGCAAYHREGEVCPSAFRFSYESLCEIHEDWREVDPPSRPARPPIRLRLLPRPKRDVEAEARALVVAGGGEVLGGDLELLDEVLSQLALAGDLDRLTVDSGERGGRRIVNAGLDAYRLRYGRGFDLFQNEE